MTLKPMAFLALDTVDEAGARVDLSREVNITHPVYFL